ncbi:hypothetical protein KFK09_017499 [Dendrobium nobile]|uniref:Endonuclease/exonuclease/phosphatase domain-containing protein n=1 Tax=Dendrobium nobile TaxID=94219 RepID=A0A8T3B154_DENNO|nr:hypothetical protein KFK09_017499 [Dendrobium nobile]
MISGEVHVSDFVCIMPVIYASNLQYDRIMLWDNMKEIISNINAPWIILGDFNCCRHPFENSSQLWDFNSFIFYVGLLDLAPTGLKFTWFNQRPNDPIHLKLDRMLINDKWLESFPLLR